MQGGVSQFISTGILIVPFKTSLGPFKVTFRDFLDLEIFWEEHLLLRGVRGNHRLTSLNVFRKSTVVSQMTNEPMQKTKALKCPESPNVPS